MRDESDGVKIKMLPMLDDRSRAKNSDDDLHLNVRFAIVLGENS